MAFEREIAARQRAGLVAAQDVHAAQILHRAQMFYDDLMFCHPNSSTTERDCGDHGQKFRRQPDRQSDREKQRFEHISVHEDIDD